MLTFSLGVEAEAAVVVVAIHTALMALLIPGAEVVLMAAIVQAAVVEAAALAACYGLQEILFPQLLIQ